MTFVTAILLANRTFKSQFERVDGENLADWTTYQKGVSRASCETYTIEFSMNATSSCVPPPRKETYRGVLYAVVTMGNSCAASAPTVYLRSYLRGHK